MVDSQNAIILHVKGWLIKEVSFKLSADPGLLYDYLVVWLIYLHLTLAIWVHLFKTNNAVLHIRRGIRDNFPYYSFKTCCDPSLEPSHRDGSNEGSQHIFLLRNKKNYL